MMTLSKLKTTVAPTSQREVGDRVAIFGIKSEGRRTALLSDKNCHT